MNDFLNLNFFENILYKNLLDILNSEPKRTSILYDFRKIFDFVWMSFYGDIIVAVDIEGEAVFITQEGVFRYSKYINNKRIKNIELNEYLANEYISMSITIDLYKEDNALFDFSNLDKSSVIYKLEPLIYYESTNSNKLAILDKELSEHYLYELNDYLNSYYYLIRCSLDLLSIIQEESY